MKPVVLAFAAYYLPGYRGGGPIRTIANMVERLADDFDFRIVTRDRDLHDQCAYENVKVDAWNTVGKAQVFYASPTTLGLAGVTKLLRETHYDVLYLNSAFDPVFTLRPLLARRLGLVERRPAVVAPRGEFSEGALSLKSWKKSPFIKLARLVNFYGGVLWHASTELEALDICRAIGSSFDRIGIAADVAIAPYLLEGGSAELSGGKRAIERSDGLLKLCFLSRIAPMKNLDFALTVLAGVKANTVFHIYGPQEDAPYWAQCQTLISRLPPNVEVTYKGSVDPSEVLAVISEYDVFFVPSRGENFGHVFSEALSAGVPILVSDRTPWLGLVEKGIGWDISLDQPEEFAKVLDSVSAWDNAMHQSISGACIKYASEQAENQDVLERNRQLFLSVLS